MSTDRSWGAVTVEAWHADMARGPDREVFQDDADAAIDRGRLLSRMTYARHVTVRTESNLMIAQFVGRYWLDNPNHLPAP